MDYFKIHQGNLIAIGAVVLAAVAPILALYSFNIQYLNYSAVLRSIGMSVLAAVTLLLLGWAALRNFEKATAVTGLFLLVFFLYGHIFELINSWSPMRNLVSSGLWVVIFLLGVWLLLRHPTAPNRFNAGLLLGAALLSVFNLGSILVFENAKHRSNQASLQQVTAQQVEAQDAPRPDIYYIILDAHTRADVLEQRFGYDSAPFLQRLDDMDFFVAACSQANYWLTSFSVGSALRMDYFGPEFDKEETLPAWEFSAVIQTLKQLGYQIFSFETRAIVMNNQELGEDVQLSRPRQDALYENFSPLATLNDFEANLIKTTWLHSWLQLIGNYRQLLPEDMVLDAERAIDLEHYKQTYYVLDRLPQVAYLDTPKFVYVHLLVPHEPFVFDADGSFFYRHNEEEFLEGYRNNVVFIDSRITEVIEKVISNSATPPIIILQGDHGPNGSEPKNLLPILNAYHFPAGGDEQLYERISPVNTFRALFSYYFGADYELLPDISYYGREPNLSEGVLTENFCD